MQKKLFLFLIVFLPFFSLKAQFQIKIKTNNIIDTIAYFRASIFDEKNYIPKDTISLKSGTAVIKQTKPIIGGVYYFYFPSSKQKISFIIENKDTINLKIEGNDYLNNTTINGIKNKLFLQYQQLEKSLSHYDSSYAKEVASGKKFGQIQKANYFKIKTDSLINYRVNAIKNSNSNDVLKIYFDVLNKLDSSIPNKKNYEFRKIFINQFDLNSSKLFFTPTMKNILVEYLSYFPSQADSLNRAVDTIFSKLLCANKAYPFIFDYLLKLMRNREIQNNTDGYAHLINKYIKEGRCTFLDVKQKEILLEELTQIQKQKIRDTCFNIVLNDTSGKPQDLRLFAKNYNYTLIIFYDPSCEHCKVEVPKMDSTIAVLEQQLLVKIGKYAICNAFNITKNEWINFIQEHHLDLNYIHVTLGNDMPIRKAYDAFTNPLFYLVDRDGLLLAKKTSSKNLRKELINAFQHFK